ncbi:Acetyltransferase (isoleucine patch superfamily) [Alteromonadaceae bacterium Bs31]|nr:Acetyltransferase (isoleucine patch superfamily) [Alteromonadaceae bacterium Bs31]
MSALKSGLRTHSLSGLVRASYKLLQGGRRRSVGSLLLNILFRLEGGAYRSATARELLKNDYSVDVGAHSYGEMFVLGAFAPSVRIGRYVSVGKGVRVFTQNHPIDWVSTHPYFYERHFGHVREDLLEPATTVIEHDVWIGQSAILLPGCKRVGTGAIIGAGAIVTKDVPPYAIVAGSPAKVLRYRFDELLREHLLASRWWEKEPEELAGTEEAMTRLCDRALIEALVE